MSFTILKGRGNKPPSFASFRRPVLDFREANTSLLGGAEWLSYFFDVLELLLCSDKFTQEWSKVNCCTAWLCAFPYLSTPSQKGCLCVCFSSCLSFRLSLCPLLSLWWRWFYPSPLPFPVRTFNLGFNFSLGLRFRMVLCFSTGLYISLYISLLLLLCICLCISLSFPCRLGLCFSLGLYISLCISLLLLLRICWCISLSFPCRLDFASALDCTSLYKNLAAFVHLFVSLSCPDFGFLFTVLQKPLLQASWNLSHFGVCVDFVAFQVPWGNGTLAAPSRCQHPLEPPRKQSSSQN